MENGTSEPTTSQKATATASDAWRQKRLDDRGIGCTGLFEALELAKTEIDNPVVRALSKGQHNSKYATLADILRIVSPALLQFRVTISQGVDRPYTVEDYGGKFLFYPVYTDLEHAETGEVKRTFAHMPVGKRDPQAIGSLITYGKRYSLLSALGMATDDDDDAATAQPRQIDGADPLVETLLAEIKATKDYDALIEWRRNRKNIARINQVENDDDMEKLTQAFTDKKNEHAEAAEAKSDA